MIESSDKDQEKKKITEGKTFSVPYTLEEIQENFSNDTHTHSKQSKEEILNKAIKVHQQGNISEATKYYQLFINKGFEDHRVFSNYGAILKDLNKLEEAELSIRKAIELNPSYAIAHSNLGCILSIIGQLQEAELSTRKAIELNPIDVNSHFNLGNILKDLNKLEEAELSIRKAIELNPNLAEVHSSLGSILNDMNKLEEAELSTRKAIQIKPDLTEAHFQLGEILLRKGNHIEGIKCIKKSTGFIRFDLINGLSIN